MRRNVIQTDAFSSHVETDQAQQLRSEYNDDDVDTINRMLSVWRQWLLADERGTTR